MSLTQRQCQQTPAGAANTIDGRRMTIGQVARQAGLSPRAVRFYEAQGVLPPPRRTASGYRMYAEQELELLGFVAQLRRTGLSVGSIREVVRMRERGVPPPHGVIGLLEARVAEVDRELNSLQDMRGRLVEVLHRARSGLARGADVRLCRLVSASSAADGTTPRPNCEPGVVRSQQR